MIGVCMYGANALVMRTTARTPPRAAATRRRPPLLEPIQGCDRSKNASVASKLCHFSGAMVFNLSKNGGNQSIDRPSRLRIGTDEEKRRAREERTHKRSPPQAVLFRLKFWGFLWTHGMTAGFRFASCDVLFCFPILGAPLPVACCFQCPTDPTTTPPLAHSK